MNWRCLFGHDRQYVAPQPGFGFLMDFYKAFRPWRCRRCPASYPGAPIPVPPAPPPRQPLPALAPRPEELFRALDAATPCPDCGFVTGHDVECINYAGAPQ